MILEGVIEAGRKVFAVEGISLNRLVQSRLQIDAPVGCSSDALELPPITNDHRFSMKRSFLQHPLFIGAALAGLLSPSVRAAAPQTNSPPLAIILDDFKLTADLSNARAAFTLDATARVDDLKGGSLELLSGVLALTEFKPQPQWRLRAEQNRFVVVFDHAGKFPLHFKFDAATRRSNDWNLVEFWVAPSALQPITLRGLAADTQFDFAGAARPDRTGADFLSYLPPDGAVKLAWKEASPEAEGKLFYAAEMLSQISVSPGLMRQASLFDFKIMQGELTRVALVLRGAGEVTRAQGDQVLAWKVEPMPGGEERRLVVQFNQPQKDHFALQVHVQTPLAAFPQTVDATLLHPESATRFAGYYRIVNEGAVRLEVAQASGLSQISPEQFPETDATRALLRPTGSQRFAYRFSGFDFSLRIQADQILPELSVSELLAYHLGETELSIDAEIELEIREAPLRELLLRAPKGYAIAQINAPGLNDYFLREPEDQTDAELRLVYGQPISGRQVVSLRLERNKSAAGAMWSLPRIEVTRAKSVRGHLAVAADTGFRLTPERTQALTEITTAFFPRKVTGIQAAFRLSDPAWQATMRVERLPQTVQADALHLFSIGEGIAYGSSLFNYVISGAPVPGFKVELSEEYFNVEFTGKDIRNWQKVEGGYLVQLQTPVAGAYTLLATYERPFKAQGETLAFTGARPLDAQSEQGYTMIISDHQFEVKTESASRGLLRLETGEVPPEYRLFFDAPILTAYRYASRPFDLKLTLSPLSQGESLSQVVDRASITNRISKEGQVLADIRYFVKNRGNPTLRFTLPPGADLWSVTVNGARVVPVRDGPVDLIPLPQRADPNAVLTIDVKLASKSKDPGRIIVGAPILNAPVMLAEWRLEPDNGQRLAFLRGSLAPTSGDTDRSGFAELTRLCSDGDERLLMAVAVLLVLLGAAVLAWKWAGRDGVFRFSARHWIGSVAGLAALVVAALLFNHLLDLSGRGRRESARDLAFLAPVQQAGSALSLEIANAADKTTAKEVLGYAWPVVLALLAWAYGWRGGQPAARTASRLAGWILVAWAALRWPNGAPLFLGVLAAFLLLHVFFPAARRLWRAPGWPAAMPHPQPPPAGAPATVLLLATGLSWWFASACGLAAATPATPVAESVTHEVRVEGEFALGAARIHWDAKKGELLPLLFEPAVLTRLTCPTNALRLEKSPPGSKETHRLLATRNGQYDIDVRYELRVGLRDKENGLLLPLPPGLVNRLGLTLVNLDVDVFSPQAVATERTAAGNNTVAALVLSPAGDTWVNWRPRSRDVSKEKSVFYAEISQLYVPAAGVIEGAHLVSIRPAQGELSEVVLDVPVGATITDVADAVPAAAAGEAPPARPSQVVSLWRFDPDTRKLRVTLHPPQSRPFLMLVRSQIAAGPLPFEHAFGLLSVEGAGGQIGLMGVATGNEVQLDGLVATNFASINLEDYPAELTVALQGKVPGITVRRAFRYADPQSTATLKASAVEADVRVETQDTLSLGEDRTVLADNATVTITRAGIFRLSFVIPAGFDVESITGAALSHWTEAKSDAGRVITLHLAGKTEGQQQFALSLAGPGIKATKNWQTPRLIFREANKQRGRLLLVPEQGLRLQAGVAEGVTQLDPQLSEVRQKGVLSFRILQVPWNLALTIEQVDPWTQVTSLQHAVVNEAQVKVALNLQYQIDNTGLKTFRVFLPTNAENVHFQGDQLADFMPVPNAVTNGLQGFEIKLHRRVIGAYFLQSTYQTPIPEQAKQVAVRGAQAGDVNLQRGFVTLQSSGRLQLRIDTLPPGLQPAEWQSIPRVLQQDLSTAAANFAYRLVEPAFELQLQLERREAVQLLPARVNNVVFTSVISDEATMLTHVRLEMQPGDKRLLSVTLPKDAHFWFAFVYQSGVWPWRERDHILIPIDQPGQDGRLVPVELFYSCQVGEPNSSALDLELLAPKFDLPLENVTWRVTLSEKWQVKHAEGSLQFQREEVVGAATAVDARDYLQNEAALQNERAKQAESLLAAGNSAREQGDPQQARRAFQAAYALSSQDAAFNEDARVQLHNIKLQQALVGLNVRQTAAEGSPSSLAAKLRDLHGRKELGYTQQAAKEMLDRNSADENAALLRLAERLIQQQDAAISNPAALRANIPEQGRVLTFKRSVVVDAAADLSIRLRASPVRTASTSLRALILAVTGVVMVVFSALAGTRKES